MNRERLLWILVILLILTAAFFMGQRQGKTIEALRNQNEFLEQQIRDMEASRDSALSRASKEETQRAIIVKTANREKTDLKAQVSFWKERVRVADKTPRTQPTPSDSSETAQITSPCAERDSVIEKQDQLIYSMEASQTLINDSFERQIQNMQKALEAQASISNAWEGHAKSYDKKLKRQRFWTRFWRSLGVGAVAAAGVIAVTSQ